MTILKTTTLTSALVLSLAAFSTSSHSQVASGVSAEYGIEANTTNSGVDANTTTNTKTDNEINNDYKSPINSESSYTRVETGVDTRFENEASVDSIGSSNAEVDLDNDINTSAYNN